MAKKANSKANGKPKFDMYGEVTKRILEQLEQGKIPWLKPWTGGAGAWSRSTGKPYTLINQMLLERGEYVTYTEMKASGGEFILDENGEKPKPKQVWSFWRKPVKVGENVDEVTGEVTDRIWLKPCAKYFNVYNVETDTTLEIKHTKHTTPNAGGVEPIEALEAIKNAYIDRENLKYSEELSDRAYYSPMLDYVCVPRREQFKEVAEFYSTAFHELGHSTGSPKRLNRFKINDKDAAFGSESYSREELVAELTACSILANQGVETATSFRNSAAYIQGWSKALQDDKEAIIRASAKAEAAYNLIMGIEEEADENENA